LYNAFEDREALLDAVAVKAFDSLAKALQPAASRQEFVRAFVRFALRKPHLYALIMSRKHATMKDTPALQAAAHRVITKAFEFFAEPGARSAVNRRAIMKQLMLINGALTLYRLGVLDLPSEARFLEEVIALTS
jgi:AcrR family transcriptional regulator